MKLSKEWAQPYPLTNAIENRNRITRAGSGLFRLQRSEHDIHSLLYYSKNSRRAKDRADRRGAWLHHSAVGQEPRNLQAIVRRRWGKLDFETVKNIHESLSEMLEERKEDLELS